MKFASLENQTESPNVEFFFSENASKIFFNFFRPKYEAHSKHKK